MQQDDARDFEATQEKLAAATSRRVETEIALAVARRKLSEIDAAERAKAQEQTRDSE